MKKSIKYDDWLKEKFEKDPELEKKYNSLQKEKTMEKKIADYIKEQIKKELGKGYRTEKTKPTTITIVEPKFKDKLYTYNCNKCKKDFETAIEFTNDKRYIRSLRCPDCAFKKIFEATNKKPKIKGKK